MKHTIVLPDVGQTANDARIAKWLKQAGDRITEGEALVLVETDKATVEVEAHRTGYVRELLIEEGETASVLTPIAILTDSGDEPYSQDTLPQPTGIPVAAVGSRQESQSAPSSAVLAVPAARILARQLGIDLAGIAGSGPGGLIQKTDVERHGEAGRREAKQGSPAAELKAWAAMAEMVERSEKTIPHFYLEADVEMSQAQAWRANWNASHPTLRASVNDLFVRAASRALAETPRLHYRYVEGGYECGPPADILLVVGVQGRLVLTPVPLSAALSWEDFLKRVRRIVDGARAGRVTHGEPKSEPVLCVSNLGRSNVKRFSAIIPPACTAILAVAAVREAPVVREGRIEVGTTCAVTLSADHRVVDGLSGAQFLDRLQFHLNAL